MITPRYGSNQELKIQAAAAQGEKLASEPG